MPIDPGNAVEGTGLAGAIAVARKDVYGGKYSVTKDANGLNAESEAMAIIINAAIGGGGGEANTASSAGSGVSLYYQKSGVDLQFNAIKSENDRLSCVLDGATHDIELTVNEGNIVHQNLSGAGTNTHAQIDTHLGSSLNPHGVTYTQVGAAPAAEGVTNGNAHDHTGGAGAQIDHVNLANKGTNTHAQIDTHIGDGAIHYTQAAISITASQVSDFDIEVSNNASVAANTTHRGSTGVDHGYISQDVTTSGTPSFSSVTATTFFGSLDTNVPAAGLTVSGTTIAADGTDANINVTVTPKGTGYLSVSNAGTYAASFVSSINAARAVYGEASQTGSYVNYGGYFVAKGNSARAVRGVADAIGAVSSYGGYFSAAGNSSRGVAGFATATGAVSNYGGTFEAAGNTGRGIMATATASGPYTNYGGYFQAVGETAHAVYGSATATTATENFGGHFESHGDLGSGVWGRAYGDTGYGVRGYASAPGAFVNYGGHFIAEGDSGYGVYGGGSAYGGSFTADAASGMGVRGVASSAGAVTNYGGYFSASGSSGRGVYATAPATGYSGYFDVGGFKVDSNAAIDLDASAASSINVTGADLTVKTTTSGDINLDPAGNVIVTGDIRANTFYTNGATSQLDLSVTSIVASGADTHIDIAITPKGNAGVVLPNAAGAPADTTSKLYQTGGILYFDGVNLEPGFADPMTTRGDLIYRNSSNVTARLAVGTATYVLQSDGLDPSWQALTASDINDFDTEVANNTEVAANTSHRTSSGAQHTYIDQNVTSTGTPDFSTVTATTFFGDLDTNVAAAGLTVSGTAITADGTNSDINVTVTPKGTGYLTVSNAGTYAASFVSSLSTARAVYGEASQTGGSVNYGGYFLAKSNSGKGVYGYADATGAFTNYGGHFVSAGDTGRGVMGAASAGGAVTNYGGYFSASGNYARAVYGRAGAAGAFTNHGGYFSAEGDTARAVQGEATATGAVENYGGYFYSNGDLGRGVYGAAFGNAGVGVYGSASATGAYTSYGGYFVSSTDSGRGIFGGASTTGAVTNYGAEVYAGGDSGRGIYAYATATGAVTNYGGYFSAAGNSGRGIYATAPSTGYSGYFETGGFKVDSSAAITLDADAASSFNVTGADLTVQTTTSGDINLTPAGNVVVTGDILASIFDTNVAAAGLTVSGTTVAADGTDTHIDLTLTPKGNAGLVLPNAAGAPAVTTNKLYQTGGKLYFDGVDLESQGFIDPMTTRGDIIYRGLSGTTRLGIGTTGKVLRSDGTDPLWTTLVAADISDFDTEVGNNTDVAANTAARHAAVTLAASATAGGLGLSTQEISFQAASGSQNGYLTSTDWNTFDGKADAFLDLTDTPSGYTTSNAIYTTNGTPDGVTETAVVLTEGTNTFNIAKGTASLDIAAGAALDVDANLSVEAASAINQDLTSDASPTFAGVTVSGLTASRLLSTNGSKALASVANLSSWIAGTANRLTVGDDGDGSVTLNVDESGLVHNSIGSKQGGTTGEYYHLTQDQNTVVANFDGLYDLGFESATATTLAFNDTTYQFTLGDVGSGWSYWRGGKRITITGDKTITLPGSPPTAGAYYITINADDGTLSQSTTPWTLNDLNMPVALILWDNTKTPKYHLGDERHKAIFQRSVHLYLHKTRGTQWYSGGELSGYVVPAGAPSGDGDNTFGISAAELFDEDIALDLPVLADPSGAVDAYVAYYRTAASTWTWEQSEVPFRYTAAGYVQWDSAGTMTQGAANKYYNWYLAFTDYEGIGRFFCVPGQSQFDSANDAYGEEISELTLTGFSPQELVFAYQMTFATNASYSTKGKCKLTRAPERIDVSRVESTVGGGTTDHNALGGLQGGTTAQYFHLTNAEHTALVTGVDASSYHIHDSRYYTETEIGSVTGGSEGALLVGTDAKTNLGSATTVEAALNATDTHVGDSTIHFTQGAISIPASQISDFDTEVGNNTDVAANTTHRGLTSNPHSVTATQISDFDTEVSNNTNVAANTTHRTSSGVDHSYIDQSVVSGAAPTLTGTNFSGIPASALPNAGNDGETKGVSTYDLSDFNVVAGLVTIEDSGIDHNQLANYVAGEHFLQSAISIPASQISDFDTEVGNNTDVAANTAARHSAVTLAASATTGGLGLSTQEITFQAATTSQNGYLTSTDWNTFNSKSDYSDPLTTRGDLLVRGASVTARLAIGTTGKVLRSDGTDPLWTTLVAADVSDFDTEVGNNADVAANTTHRGSTGVDHGYISQDVTSTGTPAFSTVTATTFFGNLDTNVAAAGLTVSGTTIAADGTDAAINVTVTPKGTGYLTVSNAGTYAASFVSSLSAARAVYGEASLTGANTNYGGYFLAKGNSARAVYGYADATGAVGNRGGDFLAAGNSGRGVVGLANATGAVTNYGGHFTANGDYGRAVYGLSGATGAFTNYGGYFTALGDTARTVYGEATASGSVENYGGYFVSQGQLGSGVHGLAYGNEAKGVSGNAAATGAYTSYGGYFVSSTDSGRGVFGGATATGAVTNYGAEFYAGGNSGRGIYAYANATGAVTNYGGYFSASGDTGRGIYATAPATGYSGYFETGAFWVDSSAAITLDADAASSFNVTGADLTLQTTTSGDINLTPAGNVVVTGDVLATTFDTNVIAAGLTMSGTTIAADGTDANIDITITPKGNAGIVLPNAAGAPASTVNKLYQTGGVLYFDGVNLETGFDNPLTTHGDLLYRNATITTRLPIGTVGKVLRSDGTDAAWTTLVVADISDFDTEVGNNTDVAANTSARHVAVTLAASATAGGLGLSTQEITFQAATTGQNGYLTSTDWNTFNSKQAALSTGNLTEATSSVLTIVGGTGAVIGSGLTIEVDQADGANDGYLSSTDWTTFNSKSDYSDPLTTRGDLLYRNATITTRLPLGTTGKVLRSDGTDAAWTALSLNDLSDVNAPAPPDGYALIYDEGPMEWIASEISISASQVSDFDTEVSNNTSVSTNTTHRGLTSNPHSVTAAQASAIALALGTTKGDLIVFTGSGTPVRLPVGADGLLLKADSAQTEGVAWASVAGTGDVVGPGSAVDENFAAFDSTTGKLIKDSGVSMTTPTFTSVTATNFYTAAAAAGLTISGAGISADGTDTNIDVTVTTKGTGQINLQGEVFTDTVLSLETSTFFGIGATPAGLNHTTGQEGWYNSTFGYHSGNALTTGDSSTFLGYGAGALTSTGQDNTFVGRSSGGANVSGSYNTHIGYLAGNSETGDYNTYMGWAAGRYRNGGIRNTALGAWAMYGGASATGDYNTCIGSHSGSDLTIASYCVCLGYDIEFPSATTDYQLNVANTLKSTNWNGAGDITLHTNSNEVMKVSSAGIHHFPRTSGFAAYRNTSFLITSGGYTTVPFLTEEFDIRSEYVPATGIFTATEAGYYKVSWAVMTGSYTWATGNPFSSVLTKNNAPTTIGSSWAGSRDEAQTGFTGYMSSVGSKTVKLAASDTLRIVAYHVRSGSTYLIGSGRYNYFSVIKAA